MKKRILALTLALLLLLALTACGGGKDEPESVPHEENPPAAENVTPTVPEAFEGTKTLKYFSEYIDGGSYTMEMKTEYGGEAYVSLTAYDGENMYSESEAGGVKSIVIMKDGYQYILESASKTCIKMSAEMVQDTQEVFAEEQDSYLEATATGDMDVNGTSCYFEEFAVEGMSVKYCFDGDALKYIISEMDGESYTVEILRMEKGVDKALFEIPSDYTVMEY